MSFSLPVMYKLPPNVLNRKLLEWRVWNILECIHFWALTFTRAKNSLFRMNQWTGYTVLPSPQERKSEKLQPLPMPELYFFWYANKSASNLSFHHCGRKFLRSAPRPAPHQLHSPLSFCRKAIKQWVCLGRFLKGKINTVGQQDGPQWKKLIMNLLNSPASFPGKTGVNLIISGAVGRRETFPTQGSVVGFLVSVSLFLKVQEL